jgi:hypothetical protein
LFTSVLPLLFAHEHPNFPLFAAQFGAFGTSAAQLHVHALFVHPLVLRSQPPQSNIEPHGAAYMPHLPRQVTDGVSQHLPVGEHCFAPGHAPFMVPQTACCMQLLVAPPHSRPAHAVALSGMQFAQFPTAGHAPPSHPPQSFIVLQFVGTIPQRFAQRFGSSEHAHLCVLPSHVFPAPHDEQFRARPHLSASPAPHLSSQKVGSEHGAVAS